MLDATTRAAGVSTAAVVDVWLLTRSEADALDHEVLSAEEAARAAASRGRDSARSAAALRHLVAARTGTPAEYLRVRRRCARCGGAHGRPQLPGTGLVASVSHAGDRVVVAVGDVGWLGVDVEPTSRRLSPGLAHRVLSPAERDIAGDDEAARLAVWTAKEAVVKAAGTGLTGGLPEHLVDALDPLTLSGTGDWGCPHGAGLLLPAGDGHVATLVLPFGASVRVRGASPAATETSNGTAT